MLETAAQQRAAAMLQLTQRPSQRAADPQGTQRNVVRAPLLTPQIREAGESGSLGFSGVASVFEHGYVMYDAFGDYTEIVDPGAFDDTLRDAGLDVTLVIGHDQIRRIARTTLGTLRLAAGTEGLMVDADLDPTDPDVAYVAPKLRAGLFDEMSFAFRIESGQWSPDYEQFRITKVDLHRGDVSIVGWGANPATSASLRAEPKPGGFRARQQALLDLAIATG